MKKIVSAILALCCSAILCVPVSAAPDPFQLYQAVVKKMGVITSLESKVAVTTTFSADGLQMEWVSVATIKEYITPEGKYQMHMHVADKEMDVTADLYYRNGYMYQDADGQKTKYKLTIDNPADALYAVETGLSKEDFENAKVETLEDGYRIRYTTERSDLEDAIERTFAESLDDMGMPDIRVSIGETNHSLVVNKDYSVRVNAWAYNTYFSDNVVSLKARTNTTCKIISVNQLKGIAFPSDLADYPVAMNRLY